MSWRDVRPAAMQAVAITLTGLSSIAWLPGSGTAVTRFALTLLAASLWMVVWAAGGLERFGPAHKWLYLGLGAGLTAVVVSAANSRFPELAFTYGGHTGVSAPYWIALLVIMGLSARVTVSRHTLNALRLQFLWGVPVAVAGIIQALGGGQTVAGFDNPDIFSPMMLIFLSLALGFAAVSPHRALLWRLAALLFLGAVIGSRTLSGLVGLSVMAFFTAWFAPALLGLTEQRKRFIVGVLGTALVVSMVFATLYQLHALPRPIEQWASQTDFGRSAATRSEMWRAGLSEIRSHLFSGVGPDSFAYEGQQYFSRRLHVLEHYSVPDVELPPDPHSLILLLPIDFGLLGVVAALMIGFAWARGVMQPVFGNQRGGLLRWSFALAALGFGYTTLFTPFPLQFGGMPLLVSGLALIRAPAERPYEKGPSYAHPRALTAILALIAALALGGPAVVARDAFIEGVTSNDIGDVGRATMLQPQVGFYRYVVLTQRGESLEKAVSSSAYRQYQAAVDGAPQSVKGYAPYLVELVRLSILDARRTGRTELGWERERLTEALRISPNLPEASLEMAHLEIVSGNLQVAEVLLRQTEPWKDRIPEYREYEFMYNVSKNSP